MHARSLPALALLLPMAAGAQSVAAGLKAGIQLTPTLDAAGPQYSNASKRTAFGPTGEVSLPGKISIEASALFRREGFDYSIFIPSVSSTSQLIDRHVRANRWELPVVAKYRIGRAFVGAGMAYQWLSNVKMVQTVCGRGLLTSGFVCTDQSNEPVVELRHRSSFGPVVAAGLQFRRGLIGISPEIRYVHWGERNFGTSGAELASKLDAVSFLLGITVGRR